MPFRFETANERWKWYLSGRLFDQDAPYQDAPNYETQQVRTEMNNKNNSLLEDAWGAITEGTDPQRLAEIVIGKWLGPYNNKILQDFYDNSGFIDERKIDWNYIFDDMQKTFANSGPFVDPIDVAEQWKTKFDNLEFDNSRHRWVVHDLSRNKEKNKEKKFFDNLGM